MDLSLVEVLIGYTALIVTVVGAVISFLFYQYFPLKHKVERIYSDLYGNDGEDGAMDEIDEEHETIRERFEHIESSHNDLEEKMDDVTYYLQRLSETMDEHFDKKTPTIPRRLKHKGDD